MKTYCLNCGHAHSGTTCPKCGITMNSSRNTSRDNDAWTYFERDGETWNTSAEKSENTISQPDSETSTVSRRSAAAEKSAPKKTPGQTCGSSSVWRLHCWF